MKPNIQIAINSSLSLWLILFISFLSAPTHAHAQQVLQIETKGRIKTKKFYLGDELYLKLLDEDYYRNSVILGINVYENTVDFDFGTVALDEIKVIKTPKQRNRGKKLSKNLLLASLSYAILTPIELIRSDDPNWPIIGFGGAIFATGVLLPPIMRAFSHHKIGKRKRLRLLDLSA